MTRHDRIWVAVDAELLDHPQVQQAGEAAACLYLRLMGWAKIHEKDGWIPTRQVRAWYDDWRPRLDALVNAELVTVGDRNINITDWLKWNEPVDQRRAREDRRREADRERKRRVRSESRERHLALQEQIKNQEQVLQSTVRGQSAAESAADNRRTSNGHRPPGAVARVIQAAQRADEIFRPNGDHT